MYVEAVFWTLFLTLWSAEAGMLGDQCDWTGSGLTSPDERGVTPVYFHCREGSVSWKYPRGALRLIFKPSMPVNERDFRVCIRVMRRPDPPDLFYGFKPVDTGPSERFPARIFMEGARRLVPLYAPDDGDPRELRCFRSRRGRAALYVEAEPEDGTKRSQAIFKYEAQPIVKKHYDPATADCRPCTDSELELAFCTSDLVSRGVIVGSEQREDLDTTQLTLRLTKLIRATGEAGVGDTSPLDQDDEDDDDSWSDNRVGPLRTGGAHVAVQVPAACGASAGAGEFVLLAARRLGTFSLRCAPRADHWVALAKRRTKDGDALCKLHH